MATRLTQIKVPKHLPFLQAICWQTADVWRFTPDEMLNRYERGWDNRGVAANLEKEELAFVRDLAKAYGSWLSVDL